MSQTSSHVRRNRQRDRRTLYVDYGTGRTFRDVQAFTGCAECRNERYEFVGRAGSGGECSGNPALSEFAVTLRNAALGLLLFVAGPGVVPMDDPA